MFLYVGIFNGTGTNHTHTITFCTDLYALFRIFFLLIRKVSASFESRHVNFPIASGILVILHFVSVLWVWWNRYTSISNVWREAFPMQVVPVSDRNATITDRCHIKCSANGYDSWIREYNMHTGFFQKGQFPNSSKKGDNRWNFDLEQTKFVCIFTKTISWERKFNLINFHSMFQTINKSFSYFMMLRRVGQ